MNDNLSQRVIAFLANLAQFQREDVGYRVAARRLTDGTMYLCPSNPGDQEHGLLIVHWQGDPAKESVVVGKQVAEFEIIAAVKHWVVVGELQDEQESIAHLFQHFKHKTGESLQFYEDNRAFASTLEKLMKDLGWSAFKKMLGV